MWKDKKQVTFLHANTLGRSKVNDVKRHVKAKVTGLSCVLLYAKVPTYSGSNYDSADYSTTICTSIRSCSTYLSCDCFLWVCQIRYWTSALEEVPKQTLGITLLNRAIELDWNGVGKKPAWMRQTTLVPCDCNMRYFCLNSFTNEIVDKVQSQTAIHYKKCGKRLHVRGFCTSGWPTTADTVDNATETILGC